MGHWHYQVMKQEDEAGNTFYGIHEYFPNIGVWTENSIRVVGESVEEIRESLLRMVDDIDKHGVKHHQMRYYEYMREEGRRMDKGSEIKVGDTVTPKAEHLDWVGVVDEIYTENGGWDWLADVTYMDGFDTIEEVHALNDLELFRHNDYSSEEDNVNHPSHYGNGEIECIDYIQDFLNDDEFQGYLRGNIAKYLHRWPYKNGVEDLKKAQWYLNKLIEVTEE